MVYPTAVRGCAREKRRPTATVENIADLWFVVLALDTYHFTDHECAVSLQSDCSPIAVGLQFFAVHYPSLR
jgi:hypothetical protein